MSRPTRSVITLRPPARVRKRPEQEAPGELAVVSTNVVQVDEHGAPSYWSVIGPAGRRKDAARRLAPVACGAPWHRPGGPVVGDGRSGRRNGGVGRTEERGWAQAG